MMLRRINKLTNLGLFFDARPNFEIGSAALIYGPNGYGKSTLATMFRSLGTNNATSLSEKSTIHQRGNVACELLCADDANASTTQVKFSGNSWNGAQLPTIVVFDAKYVADNIYSDFSVTHEHKKNISAIILGSEGVRVAGEISDLNQALGESKAAAKAAQIEVRSAIPATPAGPVCPPEQFIAIPDAEIGLLKEKTALELKLANIDRTAGIQNLQQPKELVFLDFQLTIDELGNNFATTMPGVSLDIAERMRERLSHHSSEKRKWLEQGASYLESEADACPFCLRERNGVDALFTDYEAFFSRTYRDFAALTVGNCTNGLRTLRETFRSVSSYKDTMSANRGDILTLRDYLPREEFEGFQTDVELAAKQVTESLESVLTCKDAVLGEVEGKATHKQDAPLVSVQLNRASFPELGDYCDALSNAVTGYNAAIWRIAEAITALKQQKYDTTEKERISETLKRIALVEARFDGRVREAVSRLQLAEQERVKLEAAIKNAETRLAEHNKGTTEGYLGSVNTLLERFGARFSVEPPTDFQRRGNVPVLELSYKLFGTAVPSSKFGIFSESEKRLLAFCFFLAQLETMPDLDKTIVVIDDPFSSFDDDYVRKLVGAIGELTGRVAQVIVLSHYSRPLVLFVDDGQVGWSQMRIVYDQTAGSRIEQCDIKRCFGDAHAAKMDELEQYRTTSIPAERITSVMQDIRVAIEHELKVRYRKYLKDAVSAGASTLGLLIDRLEQFVQDGSVTKVGMPVIAELRKMNRLTSQDHHANPDGGTEPFTPEEARLAIEDAMKLIYEKL